MATPERKATFLGEGSGSREEKRCILANRMFKHLYQNKPEMRLCTYLRYIKTKPTASPDPATGAAQEERPPDAQVHNLLV